MTGCNYCGALSGLDPRGTCNACGKPCDYTAAATGLPLLPAQPIALPPDGQPGRIGGRDVPRPAAQPAAPTPESCGVNTQARESGCLCHWEVGDSPCPVHGQDEPAAPEPWTVHSGGEGKLRDNVGHFECSTCHRVSGNEWDHLTHRCAPAAPEPSADDELCLPWPKAREVGVVVSRAELARLRAAEAQLAAVTDRVTTIADELCGLGPVAPADEQLTRIETEVTRLRVRMGAIHYEWSAIDGACSRGDLLPQTLTALKVKFYDWCGAQFRAPAPSPGAGHCWRDWCTSDQPCVHCESPGAGEKP